MVAASALWQVNRTESVSALSDSECSKVVGGQTILVFDPEEVDPFADYYAFTACAEMEDCEDRTCGDNEDEGTCNGAFAREALNEGPDYGCIQGSFDTSCYQWSDNFIGYDECAEFISNCAWVPVIVNGITTWECRTDGGVVSGDPDIKAPDYCYTDVHFVNW